MDYISIFSISIFISFHPFSSSKIEIEDADGLYLCHRIFSLMDNFSFILAVVQRRFDGCDDSKGSQRIASQQMKETEGKELATVDWTFIVHWEASPWWIDDRSWWTIHPEASQGTTLQMMESEIQKVRQQRISGFQESLFSSVERWKEFKTWLNAASGGFARTTDEQNLQTAFILLSCLSYSLPQETSGLSFGRSFFEDYLWFTLRFLSLVSLWEVDSCVEWICLPRDQ